MEINEAKLKLKVQRTIVIGSLLIMIAKFIAFFLTNSVGILTDAMESIVNVIAGFISLYSLWFASKPRDKDHPFGHGKAESISASIEGLMISVAGIIIIYEGVKRLIAPIEPEKLDIGIIIIAAGGVLNFILGSYSRHMAKKHHSMALEAGGRHLQSDTYSTIGLVIGLILLYFTKLLWIDSVIALIFGSIIVYTGISILRKTVGNLTDKADEELLEKIVKIVNENKKPYWVDVHNVKVIKYGSQIFIDCDLRLPWYYNISQGHDTCSELEKALSKEFNERIQVSIHSDPCKEEYCKCCELENCSERKHKFEKRNLITLSNIVQTGTELHELYKT